MENENIEKLTGLDYYYIEYALKNYVNSLTSGSSIRDDMESLLKKVRVIRGKF